jgi:hypothetical protein
MQESKAHVLPKEIADDLRASLEQIEDVLADLQTRAVRLDQGAHAGQARRQEVSATRQSKKEISGMKRLVLALAVLTNTAFTPTLFAQDKTADKAAKAPSAKTVKIFEGTLGSVATQLHITMDAKGKMKQADEVPVSFIVKDDEGNDTTFSFTSWNVFTLVEAPCDIGFPTCPLQPLEKTGDRVVVKYTVRGGKNVAKSVKKTDETNANGVEKKTQHELDRLFSKP